MLEKFKIKTYVPILLSFVFVFATALPALSLEENYGKHNTDPLIGPCETACTKGPTECRKCLIANPPKEMNHTEVNANPSPPECDPYTPHFIENGECMYVQRCGIYDERCRCDGLCERVETCGQDYISYTGLGCHPDKKAQCESFKNSEICQIK